MAAEIPNLFEILISLAALLWFFLLRFIKKDSGSQTQSGRSGTETTSTSNSEIQDIFVEEDEESIMEENEAFIPGSEMDVEAEPVLEPEIGYIPEPESELETEGAGTDTFLVTSEQIPASEAASAALEPVLTARAGMAPGGKLVASLDDLRWAVILKEILDKPKGFE